MIPPGMPEPNSNEVDAHACVANGNWRAELRAAIRTTGELCSVLGLTEAAIWEEADAASAFPVLVPHSFVRRMRYADPADPLLRQVLALRAERSDVPGYSSDPLLESRIGASGVLRKYARRALLVTTAACPVHCRYCFRRHFPYSEQLAARDRWSHAVRSLRAAANVEEVILSGGDPLSLSTRRLTELVGALESIKSVRTLRIHTRFPIALPARITPALTRLLRHTKLRTVVVVHCNHANELDGADVLESLRELSECTDLLLNQSVLLRGVNDTADALRELSMSLFDARIVPYYLHMLDRVSGSAHFDVPEEEARSLVRRLREDLPGYLVPRLVREQPGALSKTPVT